MYNQYLQQVIDRGLDMLRSGNVTQDMFNVWLDWSQTVLRLIVKNPKINSDYIIVSDRFKTRIEEMEEIEEKKNKM